jgi:PAS domain S-box-containing protein/putative nucleotidyltransferase with HDIG domain
MPATGGPPELTPQQLRAVLDGVADGLIVTDPEGRVLYRNAAAASLAGPGAAAARAGGQTRALPGARGDADPPLRLLTIRDAGGRRGSERYRAAFQASAAPCLIARLEDGVVVDANDGLVALVGSTRARTLGRSLADLGLLPPHERPLEALDDLGEGRVVELARRALDGHRRPRRALLVRARPLEIDGRPCAIVSFVDVTAEREAQEALRALTRFGATLETVHGFDELVREGLANLIAQLGLDFGTCQEITPRGTRFHSFGATRRRPARADARAPAAGRRHDGSRGPHGTAAPRARPPRVRRRRPRGPGVGHRHDADPPVKVGGETAFVLTVGSLHRRVEVGDDATENAMAYVRRLEHALERVAYLKEIEGTRDATFRALGLALEQRELEPAGHMDRVAASCLAFAREVGLDEARTQALTWGAYLHDVGKIGLPTRSCSSPGASPGAPPTARRRHTLMGIEMLRDVPFLPAGTRQVVRSHHERWDGRGYPDGLAGPEIPLLARMFALVDAFDALTSRAAWAPAALLGRRRRATPRTRGGDALRSRARAGLPAVVPSAALTLALGIRKARTGDRRSGLPCGFPSCRPTRPRSPSRACTGGSSRCTRRCRAR